MNNEKIKKEKKGRNMLLESMRIDLKEEWLERQIFMRERADEWACFIKKTGQMKDYMASFVPDGVDFNEFYDLTSYGISEEVE